MLWGGGCNDCACQLFVPNKGCFHGSELIFLFDLEIALWTEGERKLADAFVAYWTSFAKNGVPTGASYPSWPVFSTVTLRASLGHPQYRL